MNFKISWLEILLLICVLTYCGDSLRTSVWSEINFLIIDSGFESKFLTFGRLRFFRRPWNFDPFYNKYHDSYIRCFRLYGLVNFREFLNYSYLGLIPITWMLNFKFKCYRNRCVQFVRIRTGVVEYVCNTLMLLSWSCEVSFSLTLFNFIISGKYPDSTPPQAWLCVVTNWFLYQTGIFSKRSSFYVTTQLCKWWYF